MLVRKVKTYFSFWRIVLLCQRTIETKGVLMEQVFKLSLVLVNESFKLSLQTLLRYRQFSWCSRHLYFDLNTDEDMAPLSRGILEPFVKWGTKTCPSRVDGFWPTGPSQELTLPWPWLVVNYYLELVTKDFKSLMVFTSYKSQIGTVFPPQSRILEGLTAKIAPCNLSRLS